MSFLMNFKGGYQDIWKAIIRPPRDLYSFEELGTPEFSIKNKMYMRKDIQLKNKRGLTLQCSHFEPINRTSKQLPCVVYLHGNSSSRIEGLAATEILLPLNITVFCFDFTGCGHSEGDYISLGWYEQEDVEVVINYLKSTGSVSTLGIWGRSMGAVTALLYAQKDTSIAGLVLDSPFTNLRLLIDEIARKNTKIPKIIVNGALSLIRKTIIAKAKFDINKLAPIEHLGSTKVPALFVAATGDDFIEPHHTRDLFEKYPGKKNLILVEGDHNSIRPQHLTESITSFFHTMFLSDNESQRGDVSSYRSENKKGRGLAELNDEEKEYPKFKLWRSEKPLVGANELEVLEMLDRFGEDELGKAIAESIKIAQRNSTILSQSPSCQSKAVKKMSGTTVDSSGDKAYLGEGMDEFCLEDVSNNFEKEKVKFW